MLPLSENVLVASPPVVVYLPLTVFAGLPVAAEAAGYAGQVLPTSTGESKVELKLIVASVKLGAYSG